MWTYHENKEVEPVQSVQMNIYQSNTYRNELSWLHFNNELRIQERQQMLDHESYIFVSVAHLAYPDGSLGMTRVYSARLYGRFIEMKNNFRRKILHRTNQDSNLLGGSLSNRGDVRAPIKFRRQR